MRSAQPATDFTNGNAPRSRLVQVVSGVLLVGGAALFVSALNPLLAMGMNNRLESSCGSRFGFEYHRDSVTPLLWSCTVSDEDGTKQTPRPFP